MKSPQQYHWGTMAPAKSSGSWQFVMLIGIMSVITFFVVLLFD